MKSHCATCQSPFTVLPEIETFLQKVEPVFNGKKFEIPVPQCSVCKLAIRTAHRNEQYFYRNVSAFSQTPLISIYAQDNGRKVVSQDEWWSDSWDALAYGRVFDFSRPFFDQYFEMSKDIPLVNTVQVSNENCVYTTGTGYCKNCYLINCSENNEDCYYGKLYQSCRNVSDSAYVYDSELLYECFNVRKCYNCAYVYYSQNAIDCYFSENLMGCRNCFLCTNLQNKEYCFLNKPMAKEEYQQKLRNFFGSHANFLEAKERFDDFRKKRIHKYINAVNSERVTGDFLNHCKNCVNSYDMNDSEDCFSVTVGVNVKDMAECSNMYLKSELCYEVLGTIGVYNCLFCIFVFHSQNLMYCQFCYNSRNLFGCFGLRNREYCIFNKQYSKEEYEELVPRILEYMQKTGEWGMNFPMQLSPFAYNETVANDYLPLNREEALRRGYRWRDADPRDFQPSSYVLPDHISDVADTVLDEALACEQCGKNYKVISQELRFFRQQKLPVPRKCPDCRYRNRFLLRNPRILHDRTCDKCGKGLFSTYAPGCVEMVCCEECYLKEVY